jgi:hypothetical protein
MGLPQVFIFTLNLIWVGVTFFFLVAFIFSKPYA